ncbi:Acryloyl-CoA reductase AcuI/YhdH [Candidatus Syntrophocurvum alkaliphilum]|uniref:Acryloyl-CoA reductase AcuI/YhdH n=1 Tax=Candidatus Syntrophocurvum alkaliphilum TaxID=2293317 RepID=A0A6I6DIZ5_9FIRM|nr:MDR family oxidoreductase [Candidatus Syntrophocurvum alkaliphilum]QGT99461.1 Acryloyl-CoA reductase AcuI/YhdH [Candidatus Syntrophocurvum alkaliphilum]
MSSNETFKALVVDKVDGKIVSEIKQLTVDDLPQEDVLIKVDYSTVNYKEGLGFAGLNNIFRKFPMVPGLDLAGTVVESQSPDFKPGDQVILNGWSVGERYWGGYAQMAKIKSDFLIPLPKGIDTKKAMEIGTAGYTAMLCVLTLEEAGITPESGPVIVTGAAGGVGSNAVAILANLGYDVTALTAPGQESTHEFLKELGAKSFAGGEEWSEMPKPLEVQKWMGAVDTVGSVVLSRVIAEMNYGGCVASCGLAAGFDLPSTVMPFILRGVSLRGVDSVWCPNSRRIEAWERLVTDIPDSALAKINKVIKLEEVPKYTKDILEGKVHGHLVVDVNAS